MVLRSRARPQPHERNFYQNTMKHRTSVVWIIETIFKFTKFRECDISVILTDKNKNSTQELECKILNFFKTHQQHTINSTLNKKNNERL